MNCGNCGKEIFWYHLGSIWLHSGLIAYSYCNLPTAWDLTASPKIEFELVKKVRDDKSILLKKKAGKQVVCSVGK